MVPRCVAPPFTALQRFIKREAVTLRAAASRLNFSSCCSVLHRPLVLTGRRDEGGTALTPTLSSGVRRRTSGDPVRLLSSFVGRAKLMRLPSP